MKIGLLMLGIISFALHGSTNLKQKVEQSKADEAPAKPLSAEEDTVKSYLQGLFETSKKVNDGSERAAARAKIEGAFDWDKVAVVCLGEKEWNKQKSENRNKFRSLLKEIITLSAYSRMGDFWDGTTYEFKKVEIKGTKAHIVAKFTTKNDSYNLEYFLEKSAKGWKLSDLSYEDIRYSENINEQIESFLAEESFASLITKMEKRRKDLIENKNKPKKAAEKAS